MTLAAGTRLGPYEILSTRGGGGQAKVYTARDSRLGREVAIKIPEHLANDPAALARFRREARALAALTHPNILDIHDFGSYSGVTFVVTELLVGESLGERLRRGPLPWREAVEIGLSIANGLAAAHGCGVVHRDLKPDNVFLLSDGQVKILDFGLARRGESNAAQSGNDDAEFSTDTGVLVGTAGYISPEQVRGMRANEKSDLFALGCILYQMVTGRHAFSGDTPAETLVATLKEEPRDPADLAEVPDDVRMIILRCLAKKPEARFQSARDLAFALKVARAAPRPTPRPSTTPDVTTIVTPQPTLRPKPRRLLLFALAVVAAAAGVFLWIWPGRIDSLAVIPFANATGDPKADYVSDGLTESLIHGLSRLPEVRVLAWTTVMQLKGKDPLKAARELDVKAMLTGRILSRDGGLVSEAELVDLRRGTRLWGDRAPRRLDDASAAEEIAREVSLCLHAKLPPESRPGAARYGAHDPEAYDLYMKGRYFWNKRGEGIEKSIALYEQAIAKDPYFALAFAGLADSYDLLAFYGTRPPKEVLPRARDAAIRALELDPAIAEAQASLADALYQFDWDFPAAEQRFRKAIALNANYATGHQWYSNFLSVSKRFKQSFEEIERARQLDPLNLMISTDVGLASYWAGDYDRSITSLKQTLELEPNFFLTHFYLGFALARKDLEGALAEAQAARQLEPADPNPIMLWGYASARAGRREEAYRALTELRALSVKRFVSAFTIAAVYVGLDERNKALEWLEKAYEEHSGWLVYLGVERAFDAFRSDPRFQDLLRRIRLPA